MTSNLTFDLRLVAYTPLGARIGVVPDAGITITGQGSGSTLQATVSTANLGALTSVPTQLEVAVEWWHQSTQQWQEGRDCRFFITQQTYDDRDRTGIYQLTGMNIGAYFMGKAALAGVEPYINTTGTSETAQSKTTVSVSGTTFTWASHVLAAGDRVRIIAKGNAKSINTGSVYYVKNPTASTFQLARGNATSAAINAGTASNINMARVVTRIVFSGSHSFTKSQAISVTGGAALGLTDGSQYYVANPTTATIQITDKPGGTPIELKAASTNVAQVYRYLDGQRVFTNAHPGSVLSSAFLEARARGWGVGADGSTMLLHGWTTTADSAGNAWSKMADDPDTPGVSVGFQPGTPMSTMLQFMLDNQYAEWYTANGRTIHAVNYGTGNDHTVDTTPMRIGTTASSVPVTVDLSAMSNSFIVRGTGSVLLEQDAVSYGNVGKLETYETSTGSTTRTLASKQAKTDLAANQTGQIGYQVTENAAEAAFLPLYHYSRGDWVAVQLAGTGWTRLRVVGWAFAKAANGMITVTATLQYQKKTALVKAVAAHAGASGGISDGGTTSSPILESDNRKPSAPVITSVTSTGLFGNDDSAQSIATVSWNGVSADISGMDIVTTEYDVWIRPDGALNGQSAGRTAGLTLDIYALQPGVFYLVTVRALSADGSWGEFSNEFEFQAAFPVLPPNQPTTPTLTSSLAGVRVRWDGNVLDQDGVTPVAPLPGFAYVYVLRGTSAAAITGGTGTVVGTNMGNAGYAVDTGLTVGSTYYYALVAVNTVGNTSVISAIASVVVVGVSGPDIAANSVTANNILTGSITADKMNLGTLPLGSPADRVPMPMGQSAFWNLALTGATSKVVYSDGLHASAGSTGVTLTSTAAAGVDGAHIWLTQQLPDTPSSYIYISGLSTGGLATFYVREWSTATAFTDTAVPIAGKGQQYQLQATTINYAVWASVLGTGTDTITSAHVFEAVGAGYDYEGVTIQPDGLRIYSGENANPILALTSSSDDVLSLSSATGDQVATIDGGGNAAFTEVTADLDFDLAGSTLIGPAAANLANAAPNGNVYPWQIASPGDTSGIGLLDIPGRSVPYAATWATQNGQAVTSQYYAIASDVFQVEDGRMVMLLMNNGGLQTNNAGGVNVYVELQLCLTPMPAANGGAGAVRIARSVVYNGNAGNYTEQATIWRTSAAQATIDTTNFVLPANVPIYWQYNTDAGSVPTSFSFAEFGNTRQFMVIDLGSSQVLGSSGFAVATDGRTAGTQVIKPGGSTSTPTSKTVTGTASWSASWNGGGATKVTGTGQYTNAKALYQGNGSSGMGSEFGFSSSFLAQFAGKTITSASLYIKNAYQAYSGHSALLSTFAHTSAPASISGRGSNTFSKAFSAGQGQWITLNSAIRSGLSSGSVAGFQLGVSSSNSDYMYFEGVGYGSHPPVLKVTYH